MGTSVLHIKTEVECRVYLFDEEKGIAKPGTWFNLEVRKGEQDLLFVSTEDETVRCQTLYEVEENDRDYRMAIELPQFKQYTKELLEDIKLAEQGDAAAQFQLGERYYKGDDVEKDYKKAVKWYRKAAEQGNASAQYSLGMCYYCYSGNVVAQDYGEAVRWFRKSAEQGNVYALYWLGRCYEGGTGVTRDYVATIELWCKAASKGYEEAQYDLDFCCRPGTMPYAKAMGYLEVAKRGYADAQFYLGKMYSCGYCVDKNHAEAVRWYRKAAEQGNTKAQNNLGVCYLNGEGVEQNYEEAEKWFRKAAEKGNERAKNNLKSLEDKMKKRGRNKY